MTPHVARNAPPGDHLNSTLPLPCVSAPKLKSFRMALPAAAAASPCGAPHPHPHHMPAAVQLASPPPSSGWSWPPALNTAQGCAFASHAPLSAIHGIVPAGVLLTGTAHSQPRRPTGGRIAETRGSLLRERRAAGVRWSGAGTRVRRGPPTAHRTVAPLAALP